MIAAAERGRSGERYAVLGASASPAVVLRRRVAAPGVPGPRRRVPAPGAMAGATASEAVARGTGRPTGTTREGVRTLLDARTVSSAKAQRELGVTFRPLAETIADTVAWLRDHRGAPVG